MQLVVLNHYLWCVTELHQHHNMVKRHMIISDFSPDQSVRVVVMK